jgi:RNA polymerase sigma-70 factor (ECF subfamily)
MLSQDLTEGCKRGELKAQEELYKNYFDTMMNLSVRYTKNEQDAMEVVNNGFLKVFKSIHQYQEEKGSLYTWIRKIIINSCLDFIKQKSRLIVHEELTKEAEVHIDAEVIANMKVVDLLNLVRQLPVTSRLVFNLIMDGYNHKEIAQLTGISEGASRWHLSEARKKLKQTINLQEVKHE